MFPTVALKAVSYINLTFFLSPQRSAKNKCSQLHSLVHFPTARCQHILHVRNLTFRTAGTPWHLAGNICHNYSVYDMSGETFNSIKGKHTSAEIEHVVSNFPFHFSQVNRDWPNTLWEQNKACVRNHIKTTWNTALWPPKTIIMLLHVNQLSQQQIDALTQWWLH